MERDPFAVKSFKLQSFSLSIRSRPDSILGKNEPYSFSSASFSRLSSCAQRHKNKCENTSHSWERNECTEIKIRSRINFHIFTTLYWKTSILRYGQFLLSTADSNVERLSKPQRICIYKRRGMCRHISLYWRLSLSLQGSEWRVWLFNDTAKSWNVLTKDVVNC